MVGSCLEDQKREATSTVRHLQSVTRTLRIDEEIDSCFKASLNARESLDPNLT
jgi:hypothetical protein